MCKNFFYKFQNIEREKKRTEEKSKVTTKKVLSGGHCNEMINLLYLCEKTRYKIEDMLKTDYKKDGVRADNFKQIRNGDDDVYEQSFCSFSYKLDVPYQKHGGSLSSSSSSYR